jgi:hypothetical protein
MEASAFAKMLHTLQDSLSQERGQSHLKLLVHAVLFLSGTHLALPPVSGVL